MKCKQCKHWTPKSCSDVLSIGICENTAISALSMTKVSMAIECPHDGPIYTTADFGCVLFSEYSSGDDYAPNMFSDAGCMNG